MRTSDYLLGTLREAPAEAETISHQLMQRAGLIRKLASGIYNWLPLGLRVLRKVENIVRQEMDRSGALEVLMPVVQPADLWVESGRLEQYGPELLRIQDRHQRPFCLGPTHEEVIADLARAQVQSYKQLPLNFYQIQTKFRDEVRPRFGVMRAREFIMKDAYSFHMDTECLDETYKIMYQTYCRIFTRTGLDYRPVLADTGSIGGKSSHEFHVLADSGEDNIAFCQSSDYAANVELAEALAPEKTNEEPQQPLQKVATPGQQSVTEVAAFLQTDAQRILKTLIVRGKQKDSLVALVLRGDHELNPLKAEKHPLVASPLALASHEEISSACGAAPGSLGPVGLKIPVIADRSAAAATNFTCGANSDGFHLTGVNWNRDCTFNEVADIRNVVAGDPSPCGQGVLQIKRGIEVGHIFKLGDKYSKAMQVQALDESGNPRILQMGCYGIGVSRIVAAAIEQNHDEHGIVWPEAIAPFFVTLIPVNAHKSEAVRMLSEHIYHQLVGHNIEVLLDDRPERPGVKFADMDLIGIPYQVVIGERGLKQDVVELKNRRTNQKSDISTQDIVSELLALHKLHQS